MKKSWTVAAAGAASLVAVALTTGLPAASAAPAKLHSARVCKSVVAKGDATCHALKLVDAKGMAPATAAPPSSGLDPSELQRAYKLTGLKSGGRTVAIVDAYGYPNLQRDLNVYRSKFGLGACTRANGCLKILNQNGGTSLPRMDVGWAQEQALDVDAVSAACPDCKIAVYQASSASFANLGTAVVTASKLAGVVAVSNSYGSTGDAPDSIYGSSYNHPGIAITASTGDNGYQGGSFPASSAYTTAVGGTSLVAAPTTSRGWSETVWSGAGSGCSTYNTALLAASSYGTGCAKRAMADVSAASDPGKGGMAVYYPSSRTTSTWGQFGGTSEAAPIIAAVYALSGNTTGDTGEANAIPYAHASNLFDVTGGNNGTCPTTQWCNARPGWDGPTGLGTPNGVGGF